MQKSSPPATGRPDPGRQAPPHAPSHSSVALTHSSPMLSSTPVMLICEKGSNARCRVRHIRRGRDAGGVQAPA